jgi:hypothetical protein
MRGGAQVSPLPLDRQQADTASDVETKRITSPQATESATDGIHGNVKDFNVINDTTQNQDSGYPEGGTQAWLVVLGAWCAMVPSMGLLNTLAILEAWVASNELPTMSPSTIGWIFSCYAFFLYFCGAQVGMLSV